MTDQAKIDDLHERVTVISDKFKAEGGKPEDIMTDPAFQDIMGELMGQDMDTLMILLGKATQEAGLDPTLNLLDDPFILGDSKLDSNDKLS